MNEHQNTRAPIAFNMTPSLSIDIHPCPCWAFETDEAWELLVSAAPTVSDGGLKPGEVDSRTLQRPHEECDMMIGSLNPLTM